MTSTDYSSSASSPRKSNIISSSSASKASSSNVNMTKFSKSNGNQKQLSLKSVEITPSEIDSNQPLPEGAIRVVSGSGFRYVVPFPWRLHELVEALEETGNEHILSWIKGGQQFKIHDPDLFTSEIIPKFFKSSSLKSFQRQMHLYGFQRVVEGPDKGAYYHPDFVKGDRLRTHKITRTKAPKKAPVRSNKNLNQAKAQPRSRGSSGSPRKSKKPTASSRSDSSSRKSSRTPTSAKNADVNRNNSISNSIKRSASAGDAYLVDPFAFDACNPSSHIDLSIPENSVHRNSAKNDDNGDDQSSSFVVPHTADYYGTSLSKDDLQDLLGGEEQPQDVSEFAMFDVEGDGGEQPEQTANADLHPADARSSAPGDTMMRSPALSKSVNKDDSSFNNPDMNLWSDVDYPAEMDLLDDDKLTDDIISLLGTGF